MRLSLQYKIHLFIVLHTLWYVLYMPAIPFIFLFGWGAIYALVLSIVLFGAWRLFGACPLYRLENYYRRQQNPSTNYTGTFASHYLTLLLPFAVSERLTRRANVMYLALTTFCALVVLLLK